MLRRLTLVTVLGLAVPALTWSFVPPTHVLAAPAGPVGTRLGDRGDAVRALQNALIARGIKVPGGADGIFGRATETALGTFQTSIGLPATGSVDAVTAFALGLGPNPFPTQGQSGGAVTRLQEALLRAGVSVRGGADGRFGPATASAISDFQRRRGLSVSGTVDVATAVALGIAGSSGVTSPTANPTNTTSTTSANPTTGPATPVVPGAATSRFPRLGDRGDSVVLLQRALIDAGIQLRGGADGVFGRATTTAIRAYQEEMRIAVTGTLDDPTAQLLGLLPPPVIPKFGDRSEAVKRVQRGLVTFGVEVAGGADGVFGPATKRAVTSFQKKNGFEATGELDLRSYLVLSAITTASNGTTTSTDPTTTAPAPAPKGPAAVAEVFPAQGPCWFTDTWHAPRSGGRLHVGVDIIAPKGNAIYAVVTGTITRVYLDRPGSLGGNALRLTAADGTYFHYAHMSEFAPGMEVGAEVKVGQVIGYVGNTGNSSTPHLHFEYHPSGGAAVNPYPMVKAINGCQNTQLLAPPSTETD